MRLSTPTADRSPWPTAPARALFFRERRPVRPHDGVVTAFRDGQVTLRTNRREEGFTNAVEELGYQGVRAGDLVIHSMDGFAGAIGVSEADGKASPVVHCYRPSPAVDAHFYAYLFRDLAVRGYVASLAKGIRERSTAFDGETFRSLVVPLPPIETQRAVADYLNIETTRIDSLVTKKQRMIDLSRERRQSLISSAVTGSGRDSGAYGWKHIPLAFCVSEVRRKNIGGHEQNRLSLSYGRIVRRDIDSADGLLPESFDTYNIVEAGDTVLRLTDLQNDQKSLRVGLVKETGIITSAYITVRPRTGIESRFLNYYLQNLDFQKDFYALGAGVRQSLKFDELRRIEVPEPPVQMQQDIADYLDKATARIDAFTAKVAKQIVLIKEHRQALITAAVTGAIEVPGVVA